MRLISALFGLLFTMLLVGSAVAPAQAHTGLESSDPADGSSVLEAPKTIRLTFSEAIGGSDDVPGEAVVVVDGETQNWDAKFDGRDVTLSSPQNTMTGKYDVNYRVVSADGHPVTGSISFDVIAPSSTERPTTAPTEAVPVESSSDGSVWTSPLLLGVIVAAVALIGAAWALMRGRGNTADDE
ncbi:MAG TPA: copper resistance protein CopC [Aeromicrobium sp.]|nr:copper resistance protein CopC [Aeromicrobium sp.]